MKAADLKVGYPYNWVHQHDKLIYVGKAGSWFQFRKIGDTRPVWCEVLEEDLASIEETKAEEFDIKTLEGLAKAVAWTNETLAKLKLYGVLVIPRSMTHVTVMSHRPKQCRVSGILPEPDLLKVLKAAGWEVLQ